MARTFLTITALLFFVQPAPADDQAATTTSKTLPAPVSKAVEFERDVLPLLKSRCLSCHGTKKKESGLQLNSRASLIRGGDSGDPAVVTGKSSESLLIQLVAGHNPDRIMPPEGKRLTNAEISLLRAWIDQGAKMPGYEGSARLTTDHWSFQPVHKVKPPVLDDPFVANPIDAFVLDRLRTAKLEPSRRASRRTLIRRLFLVMHGLPPAPEQVESFVRDDDPDAWPKLVDQVLKSPRYGERWARHWLDIIRFGETHGFETNRERPHAWRFRDYVIDAFNKDKPYDDFVREQIAGDALGADVATGFLVAGPHDLVKSPDINLTLMQRQDELADLINATGTTFLGLTLGCARCHNHKFDPILQTDYYSIQAVFAGVQHGDRKVAPNPQHRLQLATLQAQIEALERQLEQFIVPAGPGMQQFDDSVLATDGRAGLELLAKPNGMGKNAAGMEPGQANDPGSNQRMPNISGGSYTWWSNSSGVDVAAYRPKTRGRFRVWLSWGTGFDTHTNDARFLLDSDGDVSTKDDQQLLAEVDQQQFADGSRGLVEQPRWSGLHNAGVHELQAQNAIILRGGDTGTAITADILVLESLRPDAERQPPPSRPSFRQPVNAKHNIEQFPTTKARFVRFTVLATSSVEPCIDELEIFANGKNVALASLGAKATSSGNFPNNPLHKLEHINDGLYGNGRSWISNEEGRGWVQIELKDAVEIDRIEWGRDRQDRYKDRIATTYRIEAAVEPGHWKLVASSTDRMPFRGNQPSEPVYQFDSKPAKLAARGRKLFAELKTARSERKRLSTSQMAYAGTFSQPGPTHRLYRGEPQQKREEVGPDALQIISSLGLKRDAPEQVRRLRFAEWLTDPANPLTARVIVNRIWQHQFGAGLVTTPNDFGANGARPSHPEMLDWLAAELVRNKWSIRHLQRLILLSNTWQQDSRPNERSMRADAATRLLWRFPPRRLEAEPIRDSILAVTGVIDLRAGGPGFSGFEVQMENVRHFFPKTKYGPEDWRRMVYMTRVRQEQDSVFGAFDCPDASQVISKRSRSTTPLQALNLLNSTFSLQQADLFAKRLLNEARTPKHQVRLAFALCFSRAPDAEEEADAVAFIKESGLPMFCRALLNANEFLFIP